MTLQQGGKAATVSDELTEHEIDECLNAMLMYAMQDAAGKEQFNSLTGGWKTWSCKSEFAGKLARYIQRLRSSPLSREAMLVEAVKSLGQSLGIKWEGRVISVGELFAALSPAQDEPREAMQALADAQKPMPSDMAKVLGENLFDLYATDRTLPEEAPKGEAISSFHVHRNCPSCTCKETA